MLSLGTNISNGATKYIYKNFSADFIAFNETGGNVSNFKTQAHTIKMLIPNIYQRKLFCELY